MGGRVTRLKGSRLLLFNVCSSSVVYAAGDQIQQRFEGRDRKTTDWWRSSRMTGVGAPIGAMCHYWYILLDRVLPGITGRAVARKVLADQCIFGPICLSTFFIGRYIIICGSPQITSWPAKIYSNTPVRYGSSGRKRLKRNCNRYENAVSTHLSSNEYSHITTVRITH